MKITNQPKNQPMSQIKISEIREKRPEIFFPEKFTNSLKKTLKNVLNKKCK